MAVLAVKVYPGRKTICNMASGTNVANTPKQINNIQTKLFFELIETRYKKHKKQNLGKVGAQ